MSKADVATAAFLADKQAGGAGMRPWQAFTRAEELDSDEEFYCVSTWGYMGLAAMPAFWSKTAQINAEIAGMPRGQCVGSAVTAKLAWPTWRTCGFVAETLTVWTDPKHSKAFFRSDAHREGMKALRGRIEFRVHRVWVKAADLPLAGDAASTSRFWAAVKSGVRFRKVVL